MTTTTTISRNYWFSAAHRLEGHPKCGRLHGHNYKVEVVVGGTVRNGMIIDFGQLDQVVGPIIETLDHRYIVSNENRSLKDPYDHAAYTQRPEDRVLLPIPRSTAECLARWLFDEISAEIHSMDLYVHQVTVWETHKSEATHGI